ncbi:MAG: hypothetical protein AAB691_02965 [Patescibacteria group bacterium]
MAEIENISYHLNTDQVLKAAKHTADKLQEEIDRGNKLTVFTILIAFAGFVDFWEVIGTITLIQPLLDTAVIGFVIEAIPPATLHYFMKQNGWFAEGRGSDKTNKRQLKFIFWILSFIDAIPVIEILPLQTYGVLKVWKSVKKQAAEAEDELKELEYRTAEEISRIQEAEEENIQASEAQEEVLEQEAENQESFILEGTEESGVSSTPKPTPGETAEEIAIPQEVRDPLGKLKKEYFETPPDESLSQGPSLAKKPPAKVIPIRRPAPDDFEEKDQPSKEAA